MLPFRVPRLTRRAMLRSAVSVIAAFAADPFSSRPLRADAPQALLLQTTDIAGTEYYRAREMAARLKPGDPLRLVREPDNPYDTLAIEVFTADGAKLGYVPRIHNEPYARLMDAGRTVVAEICGIDRSRQRYGGWGFIEMRLGLMEQQGE